MVLTEPVWGPGSAVLCIMYIVLTLKKMWKTNSTQLGPVLLGSKICNESNHIMTGMVATLSIVWRRPADRPP